MSIHRWTVALSSVLYFFVSPAVAQTPEDIIAVPDAQEQHRMLVAIKSYLATQSLPKVECMQRVAQNSGAVQAGLHPLSLVTVNWDGNNAAQPNGLGANVDVDSMVHDLSAPNAELSFGALVKFGERKFAWVRYQAWPSAYDRRADIYADPATGKVSKIVFCGFDMTSKFARFYCAAKSN